MMPDSLTSGLARIAAMSAGTVLLGKATVLLAVGWLLHAALARANPRWRVFLWRGVAVGLVLLPLGALGWPALEIRIPGPEPAATRSAPGARPSFEPLATRRDPIAFAPAAALRTEVPAFREAAGSSPQPAAEMLPEATLAPESRKLSLPRHVVLPSIWGLGVVVLVVRLATGYLRLAGLLRTSQDAPEAVVAEARRIAVAVGCRRAVKVRSCPRCAVPFVCGLRRPVVVLPVRMCQPAYRPQLSGVLVHEMAHVRARDWGWSLGLQVVSILLWFHPLAWRIGSAHRAACDAVCDAVSASYLGDVQAYCRTLARLALEATASVATGALAMARVCDVRRRIAVLGRRVFTTPLKRRVVVGVALVGLLSLALFAGVRFALAQPPARTTDGQAAASSAQKATAGSPKGQEDRGTDPAGSAKPGFRPMRIHVIDRDGKPIVNAGVTVRGVSSGPLRFRTNAEGIAVIEGPHEDASYLHVLAWTDEHVTAGAHWRDGPVRQAIPAEFTFTLEPGTILGGVVRDDQGRPIVGAEVTVEGSKELPDGCRSVSVNDTVRSDAQGKWQSRRVPADLTGFRLQVAVKHPDYASPVRFDMKALPIDQLRAQTAVTVMHRGIAVEGKVTDPEGRPVAVAMVGQFTDRGVSGFPRATTDQNGYYRLPASDPGEFTLAAAAAGYAPDSRRVTVAADRRTVDLQLRRGEPIRLRVVDQDGRALAGATVATFYLSKYMAALELHLARLSDDDRRFLTDSEGRWSCLWFPKEKLTFSISKNGYTSVQQKTFAPDQQEQVVTLEAGRWTVSGRVVDRQTKAPVTRFRVVEGDGGQGNVTWRGSRLVENQSGQYRATWDTSGDSRRVLRIESDGYFPSEVRRLGPTEKEVTFDVELGKGQPITGIVRAPDGKPLADADVAICTATRGVYLTNGRPRPDQHPLIVRTGADGRFTLPPERDPYILVVTHDQGYAQVEGDPRSSQQISVQAWAGVEGTLRIGNRLGVNEQVFYSPARSGPRDPFSAPQATERVFWDCQTQTDDKGHFVFDRVRPGKGSLFRHIRLPQPGGMVIGTAASSVSIDLASGQTLHKDLGGTGRRVIGRLTFADDTRRGFDFTGNVIRADHVPPPGIFGGAPPALYQAKIEQDGSFGFDDLPAGEYHLTANVSPDGEMSHGRSPPAGHLDHRFTVPEMPGGRSDQPLDLGLIPLNPPGAR